MTEAVTKRLQQISHMEQDMNYFKSKNGKRSIRKNYYLKSINLQFGLLKKLENQIKKGSNISPEKDLKVLCDQLNENYLNGVKHFPKYKKLMISYMKFAKRFHYEETVKIQLDLLLQNPNCTPKMYELAITWYFKEMDLVEKSHDVFLQSIKKFPTSERLYLKAFTVELDRAKKVEQEEKKSKNATVIKQKQEKDNEQMNLPACPNNSLAECSSNALEVFHTAMITNPSISLAYKFLRISRDYDFFHEVGETILVYILKPPFDEAAWDMFIRRELRRLLPQFWDIEATPKYSLRKKIEWICVVFQLALKEVNTEQMWAKYIKTCEKINTDTEKLPRFKHRLLIEALEGAYKEGKLPEEYYPTFVLMIENSADYQKENRKGKPHEKSAKMTEILQSAVNKFPTNLSFWDALLKLHIRHNDEYALIVALQDAANKIVHVEKMCKLLNLAIQYYQLVNPLKLELLYRKLIEPESTVAEAFKPEYLEWVALGESIDGARKVYNEYANKTPFSIEFHMKMIKFEKIAICEMLEKKENIEKCFENMCYQFGEVNSDVWIEYIQYKMEEGEMEEVQKLIKRAKVMLLPIHLDNFKRDLSNLA